MSARLMNIGAEAELLGALLTGGHVDPIADILTDADFAEPVHGRIFAAIVKEASLGHRANPVTIKGYFDGDEAMGALGGVGYLARLSGSAMIGDPAQYAKIIADLSRRRIMQAGLTIAAEACADLDATTAEIIAHADAAMADDGKDAIHQPTGSQCFDELFASYNETSKGALCAVIPSVDELLGPMRPKQLIIGAGRPGMGKTAMALSYAIGAARGGHGVLFVSLEMSSTELAARIGADMCHGGSVGVPYSAIRDGDLASSQRLALCRAREEMRDLPFQVIDAGNLTIGRLNMLVRRHARRMAAQGHRLELVVVDYLQLMSSDTKGRSQYEEVSAVSRGLKALAKDHGVAVFALAQLSRSVESRDGKRPQLSDLRDSGQIEQDADAVLFLLRQEYYLRQEEPDECAPEYAVWESALEGCRGKIEFILAKRRNGVVGTAEGQFHGAFQAVRG